MYKCYNKKQCYRGNTVQLIGNNVAGGCSASDGDKTVYRVNLASMTDKLEDF